MARPPKWMQTLGFWCAWFTGVGYMMAYRRTADSSYLGGAAAMFVCMAINNHDFDQKPNTD